MLLIISSTNLIRFSKKFAILPGAGVVIIVADIVVTTGIGVVDVWTCDSVVLLTDVKVCGLVEDCIEVWSVVRKLVGTCVLVWFDEDDQLAVVMDVVDEVVAFAVKEVDVDGEIKVDDISAVLVVVFVVVVVVVVVCVVIAEVVMSFSILKRIIGYAKFTKNNKCITCAACSVSIARLALASKITNRSGII